MDARTKLAYDRGWRSALNPARLDEVDGPEVYAEAEHYAVALTAVLDRHANDGGYCMACSGETLQSHPCPTVQDLDAVLSTPVPLKEGK
jgi:hypothetical protein